MHRGYLQSKYNRPRSSLPDYILHFPYQIVRLLILKAKFVVGLRNPTLKPNIHALYLFDLLFKLSAVLRQKAALWSKLSEGDGYFFQLGKIILVVG